MGFFGRNSSAGNNRTAPANQQATPSAATSPPSLASAPSLSNSQSVGPSPSVRPSQGVPLIAAPAGYPPPLRYPPLHSGSTVHLAGSPGHEANAADGLGIGSTNNTSSPSYGQAGRPHSAEPAPSGPSLPSSLEQQQPTNSPRKLLNFTSHSYRDNRGQSQYHQQQGPPQPQGQADLQSSNSGSAGFGLITSRTGSLSRRISRRSPRSPQFPNSSSESTTDHPDHYTHSADVSVRPQSMHPVTPTLTEEGHHHYSLHRSATDNSQFSHRQPNPLHLSQPLQPPQGFQQQDLPQQQQQQQQQQQHQHQHQHQHQQYYQDQQSQQPQQQYYQDQNHMPQPRRSMEIQNSALQHAQLQALQQYGNPQPGSSLSPQTQQSYQPGQAPPSYDPGRLSDQPIGRNTPPLIPGGQQQTQPPQPPPPSQGGIPQGQGRLADLDVGKLCADYDNLQAKYRKVKNLYFERNNEIERLQNTLAHQRLAKSRTSLDDTEYIGQFERLDGAIKNVAFEIRQSWKTIPPWLQLVTNQGAEAKGGREMTVVGRASISRWVVEEILERFFHPGLDPGLSVHLKSIEQNIRRHHHDPQSIEEDDALSSKVCNWRLTTLDALKMELNSPHSAEYKSRLTQVLVEKLVASLQSHLHDPAPPGLLGGVQMIVNIAIGLASNIPLESRDVRVWYPIPAVPFDNKFMKLEGQLPPLVQPASTGESSAAESGEKSLMDVDTHLQGSGDAASKVPANLKPSGSIAGPGNSRESNGKSSGDKEKRTMKQRLATRHGSTRGSQSNQDTGQVGGPPPVGSTPTTGTAVAQQNPTVQAGAQQLQRGGSQVSVAGDVMGSVGGPPKDEQKVVRIAGFMAVEVRGRSILVRAPVWC